MTHSNTNEARLLHCIYLKTISST